MSTAALRTGRTDGHPGNQQANETLTHCIHRERNGRLQRGRLTHSVTDRYSPARRFAATARDVGLQSASHSLLLLLLLLQSVYSTTTNTAQAVRFLLALAGSVAYTTVLLQLLCD